MILAWLFILRIALKETSPTCLAEAIGLRVAAISSKDCVSGNVEALAKIPGTSSRHRDNTMKFLQAAKELQAAV